MRVTRFHRFVSAALLVPFIVAVTPSAGAQPADHRDTASIPVVVPSSGDTMAAGMMDGEMLAGELGTGRQLGTGLAVGALTGLLGTGVGYFIVGPEGIPPHVLQRYEDKSAEYQYGLTTGWEKKSRSKKRNAFLAGGVAGSLAFALLYVSARSGGA